jgi:phosphate/sulfate permease
LLGVTIVVGGLGSVSWDDFALLLLALFAVPVVGALLAILAYSLVRPKLVAYWRPRDRLRWYLPLAVGLTAALAIGLCATGFALGVSTDDLPWWWVLVGAVVVFIIGFIINRLMIRNRPFWVSNDIEGAEQAFRRTAAVGSLVTAFTYGAHQAINAAVPAGIIISMGIASAIPADAIPTEGAAAEAASYISGVQLLVLLPLAVGIAIGALFLGHRTSNTLGQGLVPLTNIRATTVNLTAATTLVLTAVASLPVLAGHATAGAVIGLAIREGGGALRVGMLIRILLVWVFAMPVAAVLGMAFYGICRVLLG